MSLQKQLKQCLLTYPSIFPNKWAVYHHWFAVNGNGYDWVKGKLKDCYEKDLPDSELTIENAIEMAKTKTANRIKKENEKNSNGISDFTLKFYMDRLETEIETIKDLDKRMVDFTPKRESLYPLCEYSMIVTAPKNIKPEWLEALNEFKDYLINNYDSFTDSDKKWIDKIR